jgi:hypothetical protein
MNLWITIDRGPTRSRVEQLEAKARHALVTRKGGHHELDEERSPQDATVVHLKGVYLKGERLSMLVVPGSAHYD